MQFKDFRGIYPAALTMFTREGDLDEDATSQHWDWLVRQGVDGIVIGGTSGEFIALDDRERLRLFELADEVIGRRIPVIYGAGHYSTKKTLEFCEGAQKYGADALIIILPYYQRPQKEGVLEHFRAVRAETSVPIMLYNNPANSACAPLSPAEIARLVEEDVVQMIKSTFETVVPIHDLDYLVGDRMAIFYGSFLAAFEAFAAGAVGWISGILNVVPWAARMMYGACVEENDVHKARKVWREILPIVHLYTYEKLGRATDLDIYRSILEFWGHPGGFSRKPFLPLSKEQKQRLGNLLSETGWLDPYKKCEEIQRACE